MKKKLLKFNEFQELILWIVIRLGLEPRTPSLKGMCSTC